MIEESTLIPELKKKVVKLAVPLAEVNGGKIRVTTAVVEPERRRSVQEKVEKEPTRENETNSVEADQENLAQSSPKNKKDPFMYSKVTEGINYYQGVYEAVYEIVGRISEYSIIILTALIFLVEPILGMLLIEFSQWMNHCHCQHVGELQEEMDQK